MNKDESHKELYSAHRAGYEKFVYFLMACSGACIGFAMTQHKEPTGTDGRWLLMALACWGGSFYCGFRAVNQLLAGLHWNIVYLKGGQVSLVEVDRMFRTSDRSNQIQVVLLMLGVVIYVYLKFKELIWQMFS